MSCVSCGIDWADDHHDVALVDQNGALLVSLRIGDDRAGLEQLLDVLAEHGDSAEHPIPVAIETPRGLLVAALRAGARPVYAINPLAASRYRSRRSVSNAKSDPADARLLADILRTDRDAHRPLPADSELLGGLVVLTRAHQDAIWDRRRITNRLRAHLREYFTAGLRGFEDTGTLGLDSAAARAVLTAAPTPAAAAELTGPRLRELLTSRGRRRRALDTETERLLGLFTSTGVLRQPPGVEQAMGQQTLALIRQLDAICATIPDLAGAIEDVFSKHPDAPIITSFPGLSTISRRARARRTRRRPHPIRFRPLGQGLRRLGAHYPGFWSQSRGHGPDCEKPTSRLGRLHVGFRRITQPRSPSSLRPPASHRRTSHSRAAQPVQQTSRQPLPLPTNRNSL